MTPLESLLHAKLTPLVADLDRSGITDAEAVITVVCGRWGLIVSAHRAEFVAPPETPPVDKPPPPVEKPADPPLSEGALTVLQAAVEHGVGKPIMRSDLIHDAGYRLGSHSEAHVTALLRRGYLQRCKRGFVAATPSGAARLGRP